MNGANALSDCSHSACPSGCQCAQQKCGGQINDCLKDSSCAAGKSCIDRCGCGDHGCIASCVKSIKSPKALPLAQCLGSNCSGGTFFASNGTDSSRSASKTE